MMNQIRTAADVAELESEVIILRGEIESARSRIAVLEAENATLKIEKARTDQRAREEMTKATEVETILNMVSSGLVSALARLKNQRQMTRSALRAQQEEELGVGGKDAPPVAQPTVQYQETDEDRRDRLRGAAERLTDRQPVARLSGRVNTALADADSRLPQMTYPAPRAVDLDREQLNALGGDQHPREQRG